MIDGLPFILQILSFRRKRRRCHSMAMAKVFLPELSTGGEEDLSISFPRAPPPSPEMQPQGHGELFEIPASKFEGIGLDFKRTTFPLGEEDDDDDDCPIQLLKKLGVSCGPSGGFSDVLCGDVPEDDVLACSPRKRVCCSQNTTLLADHMVTFPSSSNRNSLASNGFGTYNGKEERGVNFTVGFANGTGGDTMMPTGSSLFSSSVQMQTRQHLIPPKIDSVPPILEDLVTTSSSTTTTTFPLHTSPAGSTDDGHYSLLSRSCDLHTTHPHLPHSFEATQLTEISSTLSHALNSTPLHETLAPKQPTPENDQDSGQRKRKISIKRKNPEESDSDSSVLQFSFDYSHSSTGSNGESDWVFVERQTESSWSLGRKLCSAIHPSALAHSIQPQHYAFDASSAPSAISALGGGGGGRESERVGLVEEPCNVRITSPFLDMCTRPDVDVSRAEENTPIQNEVVESAMMMDWRRPSVDMERMDMEVDHTSMECSSNVRTLVVSQDDNNAAGMFPLVLRPHLQCPPPSEGHLHDLLPVPTRHSYVEGFLDQQGRSEGLWFDGDGEQLDAASMEARLTLSKSL